jgi:hypothetical protein
MNGAGLDTFLPAVPTGMNALAEVMASLAESPERQATNLPDGRTGRGSAIPLPVWRLLRGE